MKITYFNEEQYLLRTSNTLIIPALIGMYQANYVPMVHNIVSWVVSRNFWSHPHTGFRRNVDLCYQPFFATYMYALGTFKSDKLLHKIMGNVFFANGLYLFYRSSIEYKKKNRLWYFYHGLFHLCMTSACSIVYLAI